MQNRDSDLRDAARAMARVVRVPVDGPEFDRMLVAFGEHLRAIDALYRVPLTPEDEPAMAFQLDREPGPRRGGR